MHTETRAFELCSWRMNLIEEPPTKTTAGGGRGAGKTGGQMPTGWGARKQEAVFFLQGESFGVFFKFMNQEHNKDGPRMKTTEPSANRGRAAPPKGEASRCG